MFILRSLVAPALACATLLSPLTAQLASRKSSAPAPVAAAAGMTNDDVIALASAGMTDQIIIAKIKAAPTTSFDTSVAGLKALKAASVSSPVIAVMIDPKSATSSTPAPAAAASPDDPMSAHSPGIYMLAKGADGVPHMKLLELTTPKEHKTSGAFLSGMTYGATKAHTKAILDGPKAAIQSSDPQPVFYLYIPDGTSNGFGGSTFNPKQFAMVKLDVKDNTRSVNTATISPWSSSAGTDEKARQGFTSDSVKSGVYKLTPLVALPPGEYAFQGPGGYFDFGIAGQS